MIDSKQALEILAKATRISCKGKGGCRVVAVLEWDDIRDLGMLIQQQDDHIRDATKKINRLQLMFERAIYELADGLLVDCPMEKETEHLCDDLPMTPETCRSCWRKYLESEVEEGSESNSKG